LVLSNAEKIPQFLPARLFGRGDKPPVRYVFASYLAATFDGTRNSQVRPTSAWRNGSGHSFENCRSRSRSDFLWLFTECEVFVGMFDADPSSFVSEPFEGPAHFAGRTLWRDLSALIGMHHHAAASFSRAVLSGPGTPCEHFDMAARIKIADPHAQVTPADDEGFPHIRLLRRWRWLRDQHLLARAARRRALSLVADVRHPSPFLLAILTPFSGSIERA